MFKNQVRSECALDETASNEGKYIKQFKCNAVPISN